MIEKLGLGAGILEVFERQDGKDLVDVGVPNKRHHHFSQVVLEFKVVQIKWADCLPSNRASGNW